MLSANEIITTATNVANRIRQAISRCPFNCVLKDIDAEDLELMVVEAHRGIDPRVEQKATTLIKYKNVDTRRSKFMDQPIVDKLKDFVIGMPALGESEESRRDLERAAKVLLNMLGVPKIEIERKGLEAGRKILRKR